MLRVIDAMIVFNIVRGMNAAYGGVWISLEAADRCRGDD